jgi:hypothetical protein
MSVMNLKVDLERLYDATDNLIEQQFYLSGSDTIMGRTREISVKIKKSGLIVKKFKDLFKANIESFLTGSYLNFFHPFIQIKGLDENYIKEIHQEIQIKLTALHDSEFDIVLLYTIVLSSLISRIRDIHFNFSLDSIMNRVRNKHPDISKNEIYKKLEDLFMKNDGNISILYNLSYLDALAESFNFKKVARTCKIQKSKYINRIVSGIVYI